MLGLLPGKKKAATAQLERILLHKSFQNQFGTDGNRNADQERIYNELVRKHILRTTTEEGLRPQTARDMAVEIYKLINEEPKTPKEPQV